MFINFLIFITGACGLYFSVWIACLLLSQPAPAHVIAPNDLRAENFNFLSSTGSSLAGSWIQGNKEMPVIVLMHGVRANRSILFDRARFLNLIGYSVFLFDFQAHGESPGKIITFGSLESQDAVSAIAYVKKRMPKAKVGVIAISMGGAATLLGKSPIEVDALILESVYPDIETAIQNRIGRWLGPCARIITPLFMNQLQMKLNLSKADLSPVERIPFLRRPVFVMSGSSDLHTTETDTLALYSAAIEPKKLWMIPGAGHVDLYQFTKKKYEDQVTSFFKKALSL